MSMLKFTRSFAVRLPPSGARLDGKNCLAPAAQAQSLQNNLLVVGASASQPITVLPQIRESSLVGPSVIVSGVTTTTLPAVIGATGALAAPALPLPAGAIVVNDGCNQAI